MRDARRRQRGWSWAWERQDGRVFRSARLEPTARAASWAAFNSQFDHDLGRAAGVDVAGVIAVMLSHPTRGARLVVAVSDGAGWMTVPVQDVGTFLRTAGTN